MLEKKSYIFVAMVDCLIVKLLIIINVKGIPSVEYVIKKKYL